MSGRRIRIVDSGDGGLRVKWWVHDYAVFVDVKEDFKHTFNRHSERSYNETTKVWSVPLWCRHRLREWCDYWFPSGCQEWGEEPASHAGRSRTYGHKRSGDDRYGKTVAMSNAVEEAFNVLCLTPRAPDGLVDAVYRFWSKSAHPDVGGDGALMSRVNEAVATIRRHRERKRAS